MYILVSLGAGSRLAYALASQSLLLQSNYLSMGLSLLFQVNRGNHGLEIVSLPPLRAEKGVGVGWGGGVGAGGGGGGGK